MTNDELKDIGAIMIEDGTGQHTTDENKHVGIMVIDDGSAIQGVDSRKMIGRYKLDDGSAMRTTDSTKRIGRVRIDDGTFIRGNDSPKIRGAVTLLNADGSPYVPGGGGGVHLLNNIVAYYPLELGGSLAGDSTGRGNVLSAFGSPVAAAGKIGNATFFGGNANYSHVTSADFEMVGTSFFISCWVNFGALPTSAAFVAIVSKAGDAAPGWSYLLDCWRDATLGLQLRFSVNGAAAACSAVTPTGFASSIVTGTWLHLVGWYDFSTGLPHIRVNDSVQGDGSTPVPVIYNSPDQFNIASSQFASVGYTFLNGGVDETGLWKKLPSGAEITQLYNGGAGWPFSNFTT